MRLRSCLEPEGNVCEGEDMMKEDCNTEKCPEGTVLIRENFVNFMGVGGSSYSYITVLAVSPT